MITALFIFNRKGDVLIAKLYRDNIRHNIAEVFRIQVIASPNASVKSPVLTLGSTTFLHIRHNGLWFVAVTRSNQDASIILEFLHKFKSLLESSLCAHRVSNGNDENADSDTVNDMAKNVNNYLNAIYTSDGELSEDDITNNFTSVYELLDQAMEFGYPQNMEAAILQKFLTSSIYGSSNSNGMNNNNGNIMSKLRSPDLVRHRTVSHSSNNADIGDIGWRPSGIKYRKNEIYLWVNEQINVLMTADGNILKSYVNGNIQMKSKLSGMPICKFGLNDSLVMNNDNLILNTKAIPKAASDSVVLEDCKFHQCVELDKFDSDRLIHFVPPDGDFELMKYRCAENINLPLIISPKMQESDKTSLNFNISLKSLFAPKQFATNVIIKIPVPPGSISATLEATSGKAKFSTEDCAVIWKFNKLAGQESTTLQGNVEIVPGSVTKSTINNNNVVSPASLNEFKSPILSQNSLGWSRPPIMVNFNLEMFSPSGLVVRYLNVKEKSDYSTMKYIKYVAKAGTYEIRY